MRKWTTAKWIRYVGSSQQSRHQWQLRGSHGKEAALELGAERALGFADLLPVVSGSKNVSLALEPEVLVGVLLCSHSLFHEISSLELPGEWIWSHGH